MVMDGFTTIEKYIHHGEYPKGIDREKKANKKQNGISPVQQQRGIIINECELFQ